MGMIRMFVRGKTLLFLAGSVMAVVTSAHATLVASDDFNSYASGAGLDGNSGGTGWGASWIATSAVQVETGGLSYSSGTVDVDGGSQSLEIIPNEGGSITDGIFRWQLLSSLSDSTVYMSFLFSDTVNDDEGPGGALSGGNDFIQFGFSNGAVNPQTSVLR